MSFVQVGNLLRTLPKRSRTPEAIIALHVRQVFGDSLKKACADLPETSLALVRASTFKGGVLNVIAPSLLSAELNMRSGGLIQDINEALGRKAVKRLKFRQS